MFFEREVTPQESVVPAVKDLEAARDLIEENEVLKSNPRVQMLLENDFVTEDGRQLDPGNFLSAMLNYLQTQNESVTPDALNKAIDDNMVMYAKPTR